MRMQTERVDLGNKRWEIKRDGRRADQLKQVRSERSAHGLTDGETKQTFNRQIDGEIVSGEKRLINVGRLRGAGLLSPPGGATDAVAGFKTEMLRTRR